MVIKKLNISEVKKEKEPFPIMQNAIFFILVPALYYDYNHDYCDGVHAGQVQNLPFLRGSNPVVMIREQRFYVVFSRQSDRNTCACKICDYTQVMADSLLDNKAISSGDIEQLRIHQAERVCR